MSKPVLFYFPIKARGYAAQVVAQAGGIELDMQVPDMKNEEFKASLPFGQAPYLVHGDIKFAQSHAIVRYLAKLGGLQGDTDADFARSEMLIEEEADLVNLLAKANFGGDKVNAYAALFASDGPFAKQMGYLERIVSVEGKKFAGDYVIASILDIATILEPTCLDAFPNVKAFFEFMIATPAFAGAKDTPMIFSRA